jgi:hypothetical protein
MKIMEEMNILKELKIYYPVIIEKVCLFVCLFVCVIEKKFRVDGEIKVAKEFENVKSAIQAHTSIDIGKEGVIMVLPIQQLIFFFFRRNSIIRRWILGYC